MKILIVADGVTDQSRFGGPGRVAAAHARALAQRGHQISIVTTDLVWKGERTVAPTFGLVGVDGVKVSVTPAYSLGRWPGSVGPVFTPGAARLLGEVVADADVVHSHEWPHTLTQRARQIADRLRVPIVIQPHGSIQSRTGLNRLLHRTFDIFHRPSPRVVFVAGSDAEAAEISAGMKGGPFAIEHLVNPMLVSSRCIQEANVRARRISWMLPPDARILLYAHRIAPNKGLDIAIRALAHQPKRDCLVVIGESTGYPAFLEGCISLVRKLGLEERIRLFGPVPGTDLDEVILAADIFMLPARRDTFPMMVLHAMACGKPVVLTRTCQSAHQLEDGVVIVEPNHESLARAVTALTPASLSTLGDAGRRVSGRGVL